MNNINTEERLVQVPFYYQPYPYQRDAWIRRKSKKYTYYIKLGSRQSGKDTDDMQGLLNITGNNPGSNNVYIGLDNKWVGENIFNKTIDDRTHGANYPEDLCEHKESKMVVRMHNNTKEFNAEDKAPGRIKFIGFMNDDKLVGNSYDNGVISEAGLYGPRAGDKMKPVGNRKFKKSPENFFVCINGTPRGFKNSYYELICELTGESDPEAFPGEHKTKKGLVYVDKITAPEITIPDPKDPQKNIRLFDDAFLEELRQDCIRQYGNDNLFRQEYFCDFTTVNSGLVYQGIEVLSREGRYCNFNLDVSKPVYVAGDIASKDKMTDATVAVVFQYINGGIRIFDCVDWGGKSLVDCASELSKRNYFHNIRFCALPGDSDRSASSETPAEEAQKMFPNINGHVLERDYVHRGIELVRRQLPNMMIHKQNCDKLYDAFNDYSYHYYENKADGSPEPEHNGASHFMDAVRYMAMALKEISYLKLNDDGSIPEAPEYYGDDKPDGADNKSSLYLPNPAMATQHFITTENPLL